MNAAGPEVIGAWIGGSYSPPTWAHIDLAVSVGKYLLDQHPGRKIKVFFVPANDKYQSSDGKDSISVNCISEKHRYNMLQIAAKVAKEELKRFISPEKLEVDINRIEFLVSDHEYRYGQGKLVGKGGMYTYPSVAQLKKEQNIHKMYLVQGQDNVEKILNNEWGNTYGLLCEMTLLCIPREKGGLTIEELINKVPYQYKQTADWWKCSRNIKILPFLNNGRDHTLISSTKLRKTFKKGEFNDLDSMTPSEIIDYIRLYKSFGDNTLYGPSSQCEERLNTVGGKRTRRRRHSRRIQRKKRRTLKSRKV